MKKTKKQLLHDLKGAYITLISYKFKGEDVPHKYLNVKREVESVHSYFINLKTEDGKIIRAEFKNDKIIYEDDVFTILTADDRLEMIYRIENITNNEPVLNARESKIKKMIENSHIKDNSVIKLNEKQLIFNGFGNALVFLMENKVTNLKEIPLEEKSDSLKRLIKEIDSKTYTNCILKNIKVRDLYNLFNFKNHLKLKYQSENCFNSDYFFEITLTKKYLGEVFTLLNASDCKEVNIYIKSSTDLIKIEYGLDYCYLAPCRIKDSEEDVSEFYCRRF